MCFAVICIGRWNLWDWMSDLMRPLRETIKENSLFRGFGNWVSDGSIV